MVFPAYGQEVCSSSVKWRSNFLVMLPPSLDWPRLPGRDLPQALPPPFPNQPCPARTLALLPMSFQVREAQALFDEHGSGAAL